MSSEEAWTKINNALVTLSEHQANAALRQQQADKEMAEIRKAQKASDERLDRHIEFVVKAMDRTDQQLALSAKQIAATAAAQEVTAELLQKFIDKVDGIDDRVTKLEKEEAVITQTYICDWCKLPIDPVTLVSLANHRLISFHPLTDLGFALTDEQRSDLEKGKDFVQFKDGPFDLDVIFAPDGIERLADAWKRHAEVEGFPVCSIDDIIASKEAANRVRDRESLPRLVTFREWLRTKPT